MKASGPRIFEQSGGRDDFGRYQKTQVDLVTSPDVLGNIQPNLSRLLGPGSVFALDRDEHRQRRRLLAPPFENGNFLLFPKQPLAERDRYDTLGIVWKLRHTIVHNVGVKIL